MSKKCKDCGTSYEEHLGLPAGSTPGVEDPTGEACPKCSSCTTPAKKKIRTSFRPPPAYLACDPIPTGLNPAHSADCGCPRCFRGPVKRLVYPADSCEIKGHVDENEYFAAKKKLPTPYFPQECLPFTKDVFVRIKEVFSFPKVGARARTRIENVVLAAGQPISHEEYGTLIAYPVAGQPNVYDLENASDLQNGLDVIGKPVICGKEFYLGFAKEPNPAVEVETLNCNPLLADFTVPDIDATADATVQSFLGLHTGDRVLIRNRVDPNRVYTFLVVGSSGEGVLTLKNEGEGGTVGAVLAADADGDGENDWCVESLDETSPCKAAATTLCIAHLLGCDENGNSRKFSADGENEVPAWSKECGGFVARVVPKLTTCVLLDSCFQIAPVTEICNRTHTTITTKDDAKLLESAAAALLSDNANPLITICDYVFSLDLANSEVGAIQVTPVFNPEEIVNFDKNCKVCIPEDCCFQCNPQVKYPVEDYFPPGLNKAGTLVIPATFITDFGEYKLSIATNPANGALITLLHDNVTEEVTGAWTGAGDPIDLETLTGDIEDYMYNTFDFCQNESTCPVDAQYEEDINARFYNLVLGEQISFNYHSQFDVFNCYEVGSPGEELTSTQYGIMGHFKGPTRVSEIAFGNSLFGQVAPEPDGFKPYDAISNYKKRTFTLFYPTCVRVMTHCTILLAVDEVWAPNSDSWTYLAADQITVGPDASERYAVGDKIRFLQETGTLKEGTISVVGATDITIVDATVANELIYDHFQRVPPKAKILQMETTSMFRTQII